MNERGAMSTVTNIIFDIVGHGALRLTTTQVDDIVSDKVYEVIRRKKVRMIVSVARALKKETT